MKMLILSRTGFISAPMTRLLLERGDDVTRYHRGQFDLSPAPPGVTTIHGDRTDHATFEQLMAAAGLFDCVIDMGGWAADAALDDAQHAAAANGADYGEPGTAHGQVLNRCTASLP